MALTINGEPVDQALLDQEFSAIKSYVSNQGDISCCERDPEFRGQARDNVITRVLLDQEARRKTSAITPAEVGTALEQLKEAHGGAKEFENRFGTGEEAEGKVRREVEVGLRVQRLLDQVCGPDPEPTEAELRDFVAGHLDRFMTVERVRAWHILKNPVRGADKGLPYEDMRQIRHRLLEGADFETEARAHSDKVRELAEAPQEGQGDGIDLGTFARGEMVQEVELLAFSMKIGEVSPVFGTPFGYHLIKLVEHHPSVPRPFEEVRDEARRQYLEDRRSGLVQAYVTELRGRATIEGE